MKVLVACEYSGTVRDAFRKRGHDAWSCDILPTDVEGPHFQCDVREIVNKEWDLMIAHPPCTYLSVSGMHWTTRGLRDPQLTEDALDFVRFLLSAPIPRIALENPISVISSRIRKPDQIIQPWQFGHTETKATCLWLKGLQKLKETKNVKAEMMKLKQSERSKIHFASPSPDRWKIRSKTYQGIADAMAEQWSRGPE